MTDTEWHEAVASKKSSIAEALGMTIGNNNKDYGTNLRAIAEMLAILLGNLEVADRRPFLEDVERWAAEYAVHLATHFSGRPQ